MIHARRLTLAHLWVAFAAFAVAAVLGVWQMWARSPLPAPFLTAEAYFISVTAHGVVDGLCAHHLHGDGFWLLRRRDGARSARFRCLRLAWFGFVLAVDRRGDGRGD